MVHATTILHCVYVGALTAYYRKSAEYCLLCSAGDTGEERVATLGLTIVEFIFTFFFFQGLLVIVEMLRNPFSAQCWGMPLMEFFNVFTNESKGFLETNSEVLASVKESPESSPFWTELFSRGAEQRKEQQDHHPFWTELLSRGVGSPLGEEERKEPRERASEAKFAM